MLTWFWVSLGLTMVFGGLVWWLFIETEGVYLGRRVVIWLYDVYAPRYDNIKEYQPQFEQLLLARPIMQVIQPTTAPLMLDIATGTARLPLAMLEYPAFEGRIIGVDLSRDMLNKAAEKLGDGLAVVDLIHVPAECLPFPDGVFDVVSLLEALEFTMDQEATIKEALRVLRPGGVFLTTLRHKMRTMPGRILTQDEMRDLLIKYGIREPFFETWQEDYTKVWGRKVGESLPTGAIMLEEVMVCPDCKEVAFEFESPKFECGYCGTEIAVGQDGVLEFFKVQRC